MMRLDLNRLMIGRLQHAVLGLPRQLDQFFKRHWLCIFSCGLAIVLMLGCADANAAHYDAVSIVDIKNNITSASQSILSILGAITVVAGIGFITASFFKFHQWKNNPTQVTVGHGVTLLLIGVALLFVKSMVSVGGSAVFGSSAPDSNQVSTLIKVS